MGKKLNALLGRHSKNSKLKNLANLAISRVDNMKKQHHVRRTQARSDVIQLLDLDHHDHALLRVEHVIKEQNMFDAFVMIEKYCYLLMEGVVQLENRKSPDHEFKEVIPTLIFAASRCGGFPELQQIREIFTSRFGKEFAACAVELKNNCGVNPKMIQKLSTRQESLESRLKMLKQIAWNRGITLHLEDDTPVITKEKDIYQKHQQLESMEDATLNPPEVGVIAQEISEEITEDEKISDLMKALKEYRDVAAPAQDTFAWDEDSDDHSSFDHQEFDSYFSSKSELHSNKDACSEDFNDFKKGSGFDKIYPVGSFSSDSEGKEMSENKNRRLHRELKQSNLKAGPDMILDASDLDSDEDTSSAKEMHSHPQSHYEPSREEIVSDESDDETDQNQDNKPWLKQDDMNSHNKPGLPIIEFPNTRPYNAFAEDTFSDDKGHTHHCQSRKWTPLKSQADAMIYPTKRSDLENTRQLNAEKHLHARHPDRERKPVSVRTKRQGHRQ
ncbi:unnamed protein product [Ilex paraguariensis]|uniref:IST1-like protein n=1 Tax=Ilex paraguariensis TaxID=185542 RepID=A0ABC8V591_9AQUA